MNQADKNKILDFINNKLETDVVRSTRKNKEAIVQSGDQKMYDFMLAREKSNNYHAMARSRINGNIYKVYEHLKIALDDKKNTPWYERDD